MILKASRLLATQLKEEGRSRPGRWLRPPTIDDGSPGQTDHTLPANFRSANVPVARLLDLGVR